MFSRSLEKMVIYLFPSILLSKNEGMSSSVAVCDRCKYSCAHAEHTHAHSLRENACVCVLMAGRKGEHVPELIRCIRPSTMGTDISLLKKQFEKVREHHIWNVSTHQLFTVKTLYLHFWDTGDKRINVKVQQATSPPAKSFIQKDML